MNEAPSEWKGLQDEISVSIEFEGIFDVFKEVLSRSRGLSAVRLLLEETAESYFGTKLLSLGVTTYRFRALCYKSIMMKMAHRRLDGKNGQIGRTNKPGSWLGHRRTQRTERSSLSLRQSV